MEKVNLRDKLALVHDHWSPNVVAASSVSTFDTDYLLVKAERFPEAVAALRAVGH